MQHKQQDQQVHTTQAPTKQAPTNGRAVLLFPTLFEAQGTIETLCFFEKSPGFYTPTPLHTSHIEEIALDIAIIGAAPFSAYHSTMRIIPKYAQIMLAGFAGSLTDQIAVGDIFEVKRVSYSPFLQQKTAFEPQFLPIELANNGIELLTVDIPQHQKIDLLAINTPTFDATATLVDMEGYPVAYAAQCANKSISIYRIVSDHCSSCSSQAIKKEAAYLSSLLGKYIKQYIMPKFATSKPEILKATINFPSTPE